MNKIIASCDFTANNEMYIKGDEIKNLTYEQIVKLNENVFILFKSWLIKRELEKKEEEL